MIRPYRLIGAGGTGSYLFDPLRRLLAAYYRDRSDGYTLAVIDGKEITASKLDRQGFDTTFVGENKAKALVAQYHSDPSTVIAIAEYLNKKNMNAIPEHSVVLIAADNFPVRARIEKHAKKLQNITILNGGNEMTDGSLQIYMRRDGEDVTPPLSQGHPEILRKDKDDPAELSCQQIAELPSGQQTIIANMMSATAMLNAVRQLHEWEAQSATHALPQEVFFDLNTWAMRQTKRPEPRP